MSTNGNGRSDKDALIVVALAAGASYADAAKTAGVSKTTVARRMSDRDFRTRVSEERERVVDRVRGVLTEGSVRAAEALLEIATEGKSESAQVAAASRVLDIALRRRPGVDTFAVHEVAAIANGIIEAALDYIPEASQEPFIREIRTIGLR
jgi:Bacterial regulatory proteins, lacI family